MCSIRIVIPRRCPCHVRRNVADRQIFRKIGTRHLFQAFTTKRIHDLFLARRGGFSAQISSGWFCRRRQIPRELDMCDLVRTTRVHDAAANDRGERCESRPEGAARTAGRESVEPVLRTREVFKERATRTTHELVGRGAASKPVSILLGYLGSCFLGLVQGLEFHHATRVNARSDLPIPGAVPKESVESVGTRYLDGRGVHLFCGTELFDRQATPPPGRIAASEPLHPVDPAPERCPF